MRERYKFENFRDQSFPVYSSQKKGTGVLVVPHFHKAAELVKIMAGTVVLYIDSHRYICTQGDIIFIPPFSVHNAVCEEASHIRGLTFELSLITEGAFGITAEKILHKNAVTEYVYKSGMSPELDRSLMQAVDIYLQNASTYKLEMLSALFRISALLINHYFHSYEAYENYDRLQPVIDYIEKNYHREISLSELSGIINVCNDHLIRLFKTATNKTPISYIMDLRLREALKLLLDTDLPITAIAYKVGFSNANYMTRVFRASLQTTPLQYRKNNKRHLS